MAKKVKSEEGAAGKKKVDLFKMIKGVDDTVEILEESVISKIQDWIPTGSYILNACVSGDLFKGIPSGRVSILAGESSAGKTFLACSICREAQMKGRKVIYMDSEASITSDFVRRLGCRVDGDNFMIKQVNTVTEANTFILNVCNAIIEAKANGDDVDDVIMVLDSIGNLTSDKEKSDAEEGKNTADFTRVKELKKMFRLITVPLAKADIPMIAVNHTYTQIGAYVPTQSMGGGCLAPEEKICTKNGVKRMDEIVVGDEVLSYDNDYHTVSKVWGFEKPVFEVELENGEKVICSENHRFLVNADNPESEDSWKTISELTEGDEIFSVL